MSGDTLRYMLPLIFKDISQRCAGQELRKNEQQKGHHKSGLKIECDRKKVKERCGESVYAWLEGRKSLISFSFPLGRILIC